MRVMLRLRYEDGGRPIAKWREGFERDNPEKGYPAHGVLSLRMESVRALNDHMIVARLHSLETGQEVLDPLYRAHMVVHRGRIRVIGMQHDPVFNKYTAQAWGGILMRDQGDLPE